MEITLRAATADDVRVMYDISCQAHLAEAYRAMIPASQYEQFRAVYVPNAQRRAAFSQKMIDAIDDANSRAWVAEANGVVAGYTIAGLRQNVWMLKGLFVLPEHQGHGIGRKLFRLSCEAAPAQVPIELKVIASNLRAVRMYEQEGFKRVGAAAETFFGAPQDVMRR